MLSTKFSNYLYIKEIKVNEKGTMVTGKATTSRKKTDYDKFDYKGYVSSSWLIKFSGKDSTERAKSLKTGDKIIVPQDGFSIKSGEKYAEGKYSPTTVEIWEWSMNGGGSNSSQENEMAELPPEDDVPF